MIIIFVFIFLNINYFFFSLMSKINCNLPDKKVIDGNKNIILENENLKLLKIELNKGNNLIDYFVEIGVNPEICLNDFLYEKNINDLNKEEYKNILKPEILSQFPPFDKSFINIDEGIIPYCFPKGFNLIENNKIPKIEIFNFILDNNFFSLNFPRKYITCLLFYEGLDKYNKLQKLILSFEKNSDSSKNNNMKFFNDLEIKKEIKEEEKLHYSHSTNNLNNLLFKKDFGKIYIPKVICLVSVYPFFSTQEKILKSIYKYSKKENLNIPIEKILIDILVNIPIPSRGLYQIEYNLLNEKILIYDDPMNKLRNIDNNIKLIFNILSPDCIYNIFKHILFETKILFFTSNIKLLCPIIFGFISLIYPFNYPFQIASFLPKINYNLLESISPYIIGINETYNENFFEKNDILIETLLIVDLDYGKIYLKSNENFPSFPNHYFKKMKELIDKTIQKQQKNNIFISSDDPFSIRNIFFSFLVNLFQNYTNFLSDEYIKCEDTNISIEKMFKVDKFISSFPNNDRNFYKVFCETQTFSDFIYKRLIPNNTQDKIDILFFDENIIKKNNRRTLSKKKNLNLLTSNEYNFKNYYYIQKLKTLSKKDKIKFISNKYLFSQIKNSQKIIIKRNITLFNYPLFPKLNEEIFYLNKKDYLFPPNLNDELQIINLHIISISHLGNIELSKTEMENYIYLSWIQLWSYSFWYQDQIEKRFRFRQLIEVLDKVYHHEIEIFNLLFEALNKFHEEKMMIKLFDKLISYNLNPSSFIFSIISKILDKNKLKSEKKGNFIMTFIEGKDSLINFRKRTFKNESEYSVVGNKIYFNYKKPCFECLKELNYIEISKDFSKMKKDDLWVICPYCKNSLLPKLDVKLGNELNNNNLNYNTSTYDSFILYSPFFLKNMINQYISKEKRILDVNNFRKKFSAIFWNCIWYFQLNNLDYNMFLPYEDNVYLYNKFWNSKIIRYVSIGFIMKKEFNEIEKKKNNKMKIKIKKYKYGKKIRIVSKQINFSFFNFQYFDNNNEYEIPRSNFNCNNTRKSFILPNQLKENNLNEENLNYQKSNKELIPKLKKYSYLNEVVEKDSKNINDNSQIYKYNSFKSFNNFSFDFDNTINQSNSVPLNNFNLIKSELNEEITDSDEEIN